MLTRPITTDHGLPGSSFLRVLTKSKIPARAIGFVAFISILEGLLMLVNTIAINSIFNLAIMGLYFVRPQFLYHARVSRVYHEN
jgi:hypothetical protein